jgi:hypothetical protein
VVPALPALLLLGLCAQACVPQAEDLFTESRQPVTCKESVPVCSTTAGCVLDDTNYTSGSFNQGSSARVVVRVTVPSSIEVDLFFKTEISPGIDTEVSWYETGCRDRFNLTSGGANIFAEAGDGRIWTRKQTVYLPGDHLIDVFSDAQADYLLKVSVQPSQ